MESPAARGSAEREVRQGMMDRAQVRTDAGPSAQPAPPPPAEGKIGRGRRSLRFLKTAPGNVLFVVTLIAFLAFWQYMQTQVRSIPPLYLPPPSAIWDALLENFRNGVFQENILYSLRNYAIGLAIGSTAGITIGLLTGSIRKLDTILSPYIWAFYATPNIAFQPILIVALGFSPLPKIIMIIVGVVFPVIINAMTGVKTVDNSLVQAAKVFGANRLQLYTKVALPFTVPFILTGLRLGATRGLLYMYISEIFGSTQGLGFMVLQATNKFQTPTAFAGIIILVVISVLIIKAFETLERRSPYSRKVAV
ncbi:MAG: ABC transporter permease subunit [Streptosporangiales bacterium]|nr:ABC transporter permease subunit [Streptosporangiales bacterium]